MTVLDIAVNTRFTLKNFLRSVGITYKPPWWREIPFCILVYPYDLITMLIDGWLWPYSDHEVDEDQRGNKGDAEIDHIDKRISAQAQLSMGRRMSQKCSHVWLI